MLALTLGLVGKRDAAAVAAREALSIYEAKGDRAATERSRELVTSLSEWTVA